MPSTRRRSRTSQLRPQASAAPARLSKTAGPHSAANCAEATSTSSQGSHSQSQLRPPASAAPSLLSGAAPQAPSCRQARGKAAKEPGRCHAKHGGRKAPKQPCAFQHHGHGEGFFMIYFGTAVGTAWPRVAKRGMPGHGTARPNAAQPRTTRRHENGTLKRNMAKHGTAKPPIHLHASRNLHDSWRPSEPPSNACRPPRRFPTGGQQRQGPRGGVATIRHLPHAFRGLEGGKP